MPEGKLGWRPHPRSRSLGQLALHIAQVPGNVSALAAQDVVEAPSFADEPEARSRRGLLETLDRGLASAWTILSGMDDRRVMESWTMRRDGQVLLTVPRVAILRSILLNHSYHHRGQLSVYLRLLDVPVPSIYGPSADENPFAAAGVDAPARTPARQVQR
ncbi:MAG: DinB family protein [Candidatus Methylomirabilales bacterium]